GRGIYWGTNLMSLQRFLRGADFFFKMPAIFWRYGGEKCSKSTKKTNFSSRKNIAKTEETKILVFGNSL
ncbi:hypothetical protein NVV43_28425, partial [Escherichia marmotae]|nr:hypothetical protein [Escherichia marmotae]